MIFNKPADFNAFERIVAKRLEHYPCRILCMMGHRDRDMSTRDDSKAFPCRTTNIFSWSLGILSETQFEPIWLSVLTIGSGDRWLAKPDPDPKMLPA